MEPLIAESARANEQQGGRGKGLMNSSNPVHTRTALAKVAGVSEDTMRKAKVITREADEPTKAALRRGEVTIHRAYVRLRPQAPREDEEPQECRLSGRRPHVPAPSGAPPHTWTRPPGSSSFLVNQSSNMAITTFAHALVGNSADSRGLAECRDTVCGHASRLAHQRPGERGAERCCRLVRDRRG
jgi:hypothetical protein